METIENNNNEYSAKIEILNKKNNPPLINNITPVPNYEEEFQETKVKKFEKKEEEKEEEKKKEEIRNLIEELSNDISYRIDNDIQINIKYYNNNVAKLNIINKFIILILTICYCSDLFPSDKKYLFLYTFFFIKLIHIIFTIICKVQKKKIANKIIKEQNKASEKEEFFNKSYQNIISSIGYYNTFYSIFEIIKEIVEDILISFFITIIFFIINEEDN